MDATEIKRALRVFIVTELMRDPSYALDDREALITSGLVDSFAIAFIAVFIETTFGVYIPDVELTVENMDTIAQIAARVVDG